MSIITKPASMTKGTPAPFTLDREELAEHSAITDGYYQDSSNWKKVIFYYQSTAGNQTKSVAFDIESNQTVSNFVTSVKARSFFQIKSIFIFDYDGASIGIQRSDLSAGERSEMDVAF